MKILLLGLFVGLSLALPYQPKASVCGYDSCPKPVPGKLNVHLVPHSHDDVGWLKTVDQYYYGSKNNIQNAGVQYILDSVTSALLKNPERKYIQVETSFFWKWWVEQTEQVQQTVKDLVSQGRLEFIGGGWSMNCEGATHYQSTIDQFTYGLRKLNETFGSCGIPKVGWQIDPFGHSREQASLMAQYYFDGLFFARLDYQDKNNRLQSKTMEMVWEASPNLGDSVDIFTHALYSHYSTPGGFCWDANCGDEPLMDNPKSPDYNIPERVDAFIDAMRNQAKNYGSDNIITLFGDDFQYKSAHMNFINIDKLIRYVNERQTEVNVFYSTPSCYLKAVHDANLTWTTKQDDFFPYSTNTNSFWTGYFSSRPSLKYFERQGNNILQVAKQVSALTKKSSDELEELQSAMGILQHHDAVTGTEKQAVADDYARLLDKAIAATEPVIASSLNTLFKAKNPTSPDLQVESCRLRNISECALTSESDTFLVTVYNPLSWTADYNVRLPVHNATYTVVAPNGQTVPSQLLPIPEKVAQLPGRRATTDTELVFTASQLPAIGYRAYYVTKTDARRGSDKTSKIWTPAKGEEVVIGDKNKKITFDGQTKLLKSISDRAEVYDITQSLQYYLGYDGSSGGEGGRASGAYIFHPTSEEPLKFEGDVTTTVVEGDIVKEVHQVFSDWASQIVRYYKNSPVVEFEWLVGPIPVDDNQGKEVVSKFTSSIPTNELFYTDSSGREIIQRKKNFRPTWDLEVFEQVAGNYYPVVSHIKIDNGTATLAVVTDRSQGGSSVQNGQLELMVHRRCLRDDGFGAGEALNEQAYGQGLIARGKHSVLMGDSKTTASSKEIRRLELNKLLDSLVLLSDVTGMTQKDLASKYSLEYSALKTVLPDAVQVLTLEPWRDGSLLLRLENIYSVEDQPNWVTVDLTSIFSGIQIASARETTLAANQWLEEANRMEWAKESNEVNKGVPKPSPNLALDAVELAPKQIRTFVITLV